jgi:hypothetical protein
MDAHLAIEPHGGVAHERRQFAGRPPARQVHLEEAVLRVDESGGARHVFPRDAADGGDAEGVSLDRDRRLQAAHADGAADHRQAGADLPPRPVRGSAERHDQRNDGDQQDADVLAHRGEP